MINQFFKSRNSALESMHEEVGGYVINYEDEKLGQGYMLLDDDAAEAWGVVERYPHDVWEAGNWIEEDAGEQRDMTELVESAYDQCTNEAQRDLLSDGEAIGRMGLAGLRRWLEDEGIGALDNEGKKDE